MASGYLGKWLGWEFIFYFFGSTGLIWCLAFVVFTADTPKTSRRVSEDEREYIQLTAEAKDGDAKKPLPPLRSMLSSVPVIALIFAQACNNWGYYSLSSAMPTYLNDVQGTSLEQVI